MINIDFNKLKVIFSVFTYNSGLNIAIALFLAVPVTYIWNFTLPDLFVGIKSINYAQSFLLIVFVKLLFKNWMNEGIEMLVKISKMQDMQYNVHYNFYNQLLTRLDNYKDNNKDNLPPNA